MIFLKKELRPSNWQKKWDLILTQSILGFAEVNLANFTGETGISVNYAKVLCITENLKKHSGYF